MLRLKKHETHVLDTERKNYMQDNIMIATNTAYGVAVLETNIR